MSEIIIGEPFDIKIEIIGYEENLGSIKLLQKYAVVLLEDRAIEINNYSWVECKVWDAFVSQVYKISTGDNLAAKLYTMSDEVILEIRKFEVITLTAYFDRGTIKNNIHAKASIVAEINIDQLKYLYEQLSSLAKWW